MASSIRTIIYNADESYGASLRSTLLKFNNVHIVAEVDEPVVLTHALHQFPADVLVAHLDPIPEIVLPSLGEVAAANPDLVIIAVSESTNGTLILSAMRQGVREFLNKPIDTQLLEQALGKIAERSAGKPKHGEIISVIGGAGGVGSTTLAVNLAAELQDLSEGNVVVVDMDHRFGQVALFLDASPTYTIADLCATPEAPEPQLIERALVRLSSGLQVLSRPLHFSQADNLTAAHCVGVLSALAEFNDYVIIDGPTRFDFGTKAVLDISDHSLLLLQLLVPTVRNVHRMLEGMNEVGFNLDRIQLVCNRVGCEGTGVSVDDVERTLNLKIFAEIPDEWGTVSGAINVGEPLIHKAPKSKVRQAIRTMAERLHSPDAHTDDKEKDKKKKGLLSKIF